MNPARDRLLAIASAALVFAVYLATIYPGLLDVGDAAKFSFVGKVLGTPHAPGYPLYVMVSHVFSYVPWGTLAYRMNTLSALFGAVTVAAVYFAARRLGAGPAVACSAAVALGLGDSFWSRALYAKAYTLNSALVAIGILLLLRWNDTRRMADFYRAAAVFALAAGNHLTIIALVPALVLFSVVTAPREVLRPRTLAAVAAMVLAGLGQYLFILVRTLQGAPYLEARASNLGELWAVMTARRFSHEIGAFSTSELMSTRLPHVARLIRDEFGLFGIVLAVAGLAVLGVRRPRQALLVGVGAAGVSLLTANMGSQEDQGFMLTAFVLLWMAAAAGLQFLVAAVQRQGSAPAAVAALCIAATPPALQAAGNYQRNDRHRETFETRYFDALFAHLPQKAAFVDDEYRINMMLLYKLLGEQAGGARDIRVIRQDRDTIARMRRDGFEVFTFHDGRQALMRFGVGLEPHQFAASADEMAALHRRPLFRVVFTPECHDIGNTGWHDLTGVTLPKGRLTVTIDNYRPFDARLTAYAGADSIRGIALVNPEGAGSPSIDVEVFRPADANARAALAARVVSDGAALPEALLTARTVARAAVQVNDKGAYSTFGLDFGGPLTAFAAAAVTDLDNPKRARVCSHPLAQADALPAGRTHRRIALDAADVHFEDGWHDVERTGNAAWRWTAETARLILPLDHPRPIIFGVDARPLTHRGPSDTAVTLVLNGYQLERHALPAAPTTIAWTLRREQLREGLNEIVLEVSGAKSPAELGLSTDRRVLGVSVTGLTLTDAQQRATK